MEKISTDLKPAFSNLVPTRSGGLTIPTIYSHLPNYTSSTFIFHHWSLIFLGAQEQQLQSFTLKGIIVMSITQNIPRYANGYLPLSLPTFQKHCSILSVAYIQVYLYIKKGKSVPGFF